MGQRQLRLNLDSNLSVPCSPRVSAAIEDLSKAKGVDARGAVFTRPEIVEFILDLVGYTSNRLLHKKRILEPSFGEGGFLLPIVRRLIEAWEKAQGSGNILDDLGDALQAVELHRESYQSTHAAVVELLKQVGLTQETSTALADRWLIQGDFLLVPIIGKFDFIVGNPPYVRQEMIPAPLLAEYRYRYETIYDRADLYIPFIERSLYLLERKGLLGFICTDRWMKNRYGGPLCRLISEQFHLKIYVDLFGTSSFQTDVTAYPAVTIIGKEPPGITRLAYRPDIDKHELQKLAKELQESKPLKANSTTREATNVVKGSEPWLLESADQMALIRRLESNFPSIEAVGCKIGIGVATGADKVFIGDYETLDVEPDRKLKLATTKDILSGEVHWRGQGIINPFAEGGGLVNLDDYPRLRRYLEDRREVIESRHCARKSPANWYRTIDRIVPALSLRPKLLIPDIKDKAHVVFENGVLYPHHNLYYVISDEWNLRALQAVMLSAITRVFVSTYSTKMRGGFLRFQAQYLRRIRTPLWSSVPEALQRELIAAGLKRDLQACNTAAFKLYGLNSDERAALEGSEE